jgi:hypothetical protein
MKTLTSVLQIAGFGVLCYGLYLYDPRLSYTVGGIIILIAGTVADLLIKGK